MSECKSKSFSRDDSVPYGKGASPGEPLVLLLRTEACDNRKDSPRTGVWFRELRGDLCASLRPPASLESRYFSGRTGGSSSGHNPQVPGR